MYLGGGGHHFMPATAIFQKLYFLKIASKIQEILKNAKFSIGNFIELSNGMSFDFIAVIFEIFNIFDSL